MVSHEDKCIFIHIPKTGGESINALFPEQDKQVPKHANAKQVRHYLGDEKWDEYFKFTVIRNPWEQALSMYSHLRKPLYQRKKILRKYGKDVLNPVNACQVAMKNSFPQYLKIVMMGNQHQEEMDRENWPVNHFAPYCDWLDDGRKKLSVDRVLRFENLGEEISCLEELIKRKIELSHVNKSRHKHYSKYYDDKSIYIIQNHYHEDIVTFGYRFLDRRRIQDKVLVKLGLQLKNI